MEQYENCRRITLEQFESDPGRYVRESESEPIVVVDDTGSISVLSCPPEE